MSAITIVCCTSCGEELARFRPVNASTVPGATLLPRDSFVVRTLISDGGSYSSYNGNVRSGEVVGYFCATCGERFRLKSYQPKADERTTEEVFLELIRAICREEIQAAGGEQ